MDLKLTIPSRLIRQLFLTLLSILFLVLLSLMSIDFHYSTPSQGRERFSVCDMG